MAESHQMKLSSICLDSFLADSAAQDLRSKVMKARRVDVLYDMFPELSMEKGLRMVTNSDDVQGKGKERKGDAQNDVLDDVVRRSYTMNGNPFVPGDDAYRDEDDRFFLKLGPQDKKRLQKEKVNLANKLGKLSENHGAFWIDVPRGKPQDRAPPVAGRDAQDRGQDPELIENILSAAKSLFHDVGEESKKRLGIGMPKLMDANPTLLEANNAGREGTGSEKFYGKVGLRGYYEYWNPRENFNSNGTSGDPDSDPTANANPKGNFKPSKPTRHVKPGCIGQHVIGPSNLSVRVPYAGMTGNGNGMSGSGNAEATDTMIMVPRIENIEGFSFGHYWRTLKSGRRQPNVYNPLEDTNVWPTIKPQEPQLETAQSMSSTFHSDSQRLLEQELTYLFDDIGYLLIRAFSLHLHEDESLLPAVWCGGEVWSLLNAELRRAVLKEGDGIDNREDGKNLLNKSQPGYKSQPLQEDAQKSRSSQKREAKKADFDPKSRSSGTSDTKSGEGKGKRASDSSQTDKPATKSSGGSSQALPPVSTGHGIRETPFEIDPWSQTPATDWSLLTMTLADEKWRMEMQSSEAAKNASMRREREAREAATVLETGRKSEKPAELAGENGDIEKDDGDDDEDDLLDENVFLQVKNQFKKSKVLVNVGDFLGFMSNGRYRSPLKRPLFPLGDQNPDQRDSVSLTYNFCPRYDVKLQGTEEVPPQFLEKYTLFQRLPFGGTSADNSGTVATVISEEDGLMNEISSGHKTGPSVNAGIPGIVPPSGPTADAQHEGEIQSDVPIVEGECNVQGNVENDPYDLAGVSFGNFIAQKWWNVNQDWIRNLENAQRNA